MEKELRNDRMAADRWKQACEAGCCQSNYRRERGMTEARDDYFVDGVQWADEHPKQSWWRPVTELPKKGEQILVKTDNGTHWFVRWDGDGRDFNFGFIELVCSNGERIPIPFNHKVVAWRPLADVLNEYADHGVILCQQESSGNDNQLLDRNIAELPISVRLMVILKAAKVYTLRDMVRLNEQDYLAMRNFGRKSLTEVRDLFDAYNLQFGMDV